LGTVPDVRAAAARHPALMSTSISIALGGTRARRAPLGARVLLRLRAHGLDGRLAKGADPAASTLLSLRAHALVARAERDRIATDLERILALAERREPRRLGAVPVQGYQVSAAAGPMRRLIALLRGPEDVAPRGVAMARRLVVDGTTPVYARGPRGAVTRAVRDAIAHADPRFHRT
jgi:hypothetical protein